MSKNKQHAVRISHQMIPVTSEDASRAGIPPRERKKLNLEDFQQMRSHGFAEPISEILRCDVWVEQPLDDHWLAAFRLSSQAGVPVVSEVRIFPRETDSHRKPGEWSGNILGAKAANVPPGGITGRLLRMARPGLTGVALRDFIDLLRKQAPNHVAEVMSEIGAPEKSGEVSPKRTRRGRPDIFYARIAREYEKLCVARVKNVSQKLASRFKVSPEQARDMVFEARERGLLSRPPEMPDKRGTQGKPDGALTPKARALLEGSSKQTLKKRRS